MKNNRLTPGATTNKVILKNSWDFKDGATKEFQFLKCVHVQCATSNDRLFSLYCDNNFERMRYAHFEEREVSPRFSAFVYETISDPPLKLMGQLMGIISCIPSTEIEQGKNKLRFLVARLERSPANVYSSRALPYPLTQYTIQHRDVVIDCIEAKDIKHTLFLIAALDKGMDMSSVGFLPTAERKSYFYVLEEDIVKCTRLMSYTSYLGRNNTALAAKRTSNDKEYFNFCPFMSAENMAQLKELLDVQRNVEDFQNDDVEAFEHDLEDESNDFMSAYVQDEYN